MQQFDILLKFQVQYNYYARKRTLEHYAKPLLKLRREILKYYFSVSFHFSKPEEKCRCCLLISVCFFWPEQWATESRSWYVDFPGLLFRLMWTIGTIRKNNRELQFMHIVLAVLQVLCVPVCVCACMCVCLNKVIASRCNGKRWK